MTDAQLAAMTKALIAPFVHEATPEEWDAIFDWHRAETDPDRAAAAAPFILERLRRLGWELTLIERPMTQKLVDE